MRLPLKNFFFVNEEDVGKKDHIEADYRLKFVP